MDGASLGLGVMPLASELFTVGVNGYRFLENFKSTGRDCQQVLTKLQIEDGRFRGIGRTIGLGQSQWNGLGDDRLNRAVMDTLCSIALTVANANKLVQRYGLVREDSTGTIEDVTSQMDAIQILQDVDYQSLAGIEVVSQRLERYKAVMRTTQSSISTLRKFRWALIDREKFTRLVQELKYNNDVLYCVLSRERRLIASELVNHELLKTNDMSKLREISAAGQESYPRISEKATVKRQVLISQMDSKGAPSTLISSQALEIGRSCMPRRSLGTWTSSDGDVNDVLIEWKMGGLISAPSSGQQKNAMAIGRIQTVVQLLKSKAPKDFRTLECVGYCNEAEIGIVYKMPPSTCSMSQQLKHSPWSLTQLLHDKDTTHKIYGGRPPLEERFQLAHALALAISGFHQVGWLHKGISATNILFFPNNSALDLNISTPFLTGFDFSRDLGDIKFSEDTDSSQDPYRHPKRTSNVHFERSFDVYALGLVLLEIAFWEPLTILAGLVNSKKQVIAKTPEEIRDCLQERLLDSGRLRYLQGSAYFNAVTHCLNAGFDKGIEDDIDPMEAGSFFSMVTSGLAIFTPE